VRYVLEGRVRRLGNQLRVTAELIDAETDAHLWAERFDRDRGDLSALQNEITSGIANALNLEMIAAEAARPTDNPDALDYILRGHAAWNNVPTRDNYAQAINLFEHALTLDPGSVDAQSLLASALADRVLAFPTNSVDGDIKRVEKGAQRQPRTMVRSRLPRLCICPKRRSRACGRRTCQRQESRRRRSFFKHRPFGGHRVFRDV
jgi:adenylate cyclase